MISCYLLFLLAIIHFDDETFAFKLWKHPRIVGNCLFNHQLSIRLYSNQIKNGNVRESHPKLDFTEDFYSVIEISPDSDTQTIKKAYYKMVFKYHPDNKIGDDVKELCNRQMMVINAAYKVLRDEKLRERYDIKRRSGYYGSNAGIKESNIDEKYNENKKNSSSNEKYNDINNMKTEQKDSKSQDRRSNQSSYNSNQRSRYDDFTPRQDYFNKVDDGEEEDIQTESLSDILSDLWKDLSNNKGGTLLNDLNDFLEQSINEKSFDSKSSKFTNPEMLNAEVLAIKSVLNNLIDHSNNLKSSIMVEEAILKLNSPSNTIESSSTSALEARLSRIEAIQGMKARLLTVNNQIKDLQKDLDLALAKQLKDRFSSDESKRKYADNVNNDQSNSYSKDKSAYSRSTKSTETQKKTYDTNQSRVSSKDLIDIEIRKLKEKMKYKK